MNQNVNQRQNHVPQPTVRLLTERSKDEVSRSAPSNIRACPVRRIQFVLKAVSCHQEDERSNYLTP